MFGGDSDEADAMTKPEENEVKQEEKKQKEPAKEPAEEEDLFSDL